ncbi:MAG: LamG-like jellyroll fold domain-containing protein, partial [Bacteroidia bacterium]
VFAKTPNAKFSISFWANTLQYSSTQGDNVIIAKSGAGSSGPYQWYVSHEKDSSVVVLISYATLAGVNYYEVKSPTKVPINEWFHGVITYDGSLDSNADRLKIFINKQPGIYSRSLGSGGTTTINSVQEVTIGGTYSSGNPTNGYQGRIDEVRLYDIVLGSTAIDTLYMYKKPVSPLPPPMGLVAYWPLDSNTNDLSGNGYHGTNVGSPVAVSDVNGNLAKAYSFNGTSQYIKCGDILDSLFSRNPSTRFSISFWAKTNQLTLTQGDNVLIAKSGAGSAGPYQWYMAHESNGSIVALISYASQASTNFYEVKSQASIGENQWFHAVLTYDGTLTNNADRLKIYVDKQAGVYSRSTGPGGTTTNNTTQEVTIGGTYLSGNPVNSYNGSMDEIRIYDYVLPPTEIDSLYNYKVSVPPPPPSPPVGLVAYWPLDSNAKDYSGFNFHGTKINGPVVESDVNGNMGSHAFNGTTQYIKCGDILDSVFAKTPNAKFSISFWANTLQYSSTQGDNVIIAKSGAGSSGPYQWYVSHEKDSSVVVLISYATLAGVNYYEVKSPTKVPINEWFHGVITYDGSLDSNADRLKIFINKQPGIYSRSLGSGGTTTINSVQEVTIGGTYSSGNPTNGYQGRIDEVRLYDIVLGSTAIDTLYMYKKPVSPLPPPMGLVAYWPLDSNTNDLSGNGYHGTNVGSPVAVSDVNGNLAKAYSFNGTSQYIKCGDILDSLFSRNPSTRFSISLWAKTNQLSLTQGDNVFMAKSGAGSAGPYQWYMAHESNGSIVALISYATQASTNFYEVKSQTSIGENQWFHAVLTYDGTLTNNADRLKIYVDKQAGVYSRSTGPGGTTTNNTTQEVTIGGTYLSGNPVNSYSGSMDEIRIYDYVLPSTEIDSLYNYKISVPPPPPSPPVGLVAYWPLDSNAKDYSGFNFDGTKINGPVVESDVNGNMGSHAFNGTTQYIKYGDILDSVFAKTPNAKFSISFWANTLQYSSTQGDNVIIAKSGAGSSGPYQWYVSHEKDSSVVVLISYATLAGVNYYEVKSPTKVPINEWFHGVITYDGSLDSNADRLKIFINKQPGIYSRSLGSGGTTTINSVQEVTIGGTYSSGNPTNGYQGRIDEVRLYDIVLGSTAIDTLYMYKKPVSPLPPPMGLVAYWPLDSNTNDLSGNGYHGTNVGSPVAVSDVNGNLAKAYSFNGTSQYIKCGDILDSLFSRNPSTRFSISFWAKTNQLSLTQGDNVLIAKSGAGSAGPYQWYMAHESNGSVVALISYATQAATNFYEVKSQTSIGENQWFHAVLTYDGTLTNNADRLNIYIDKQAGVFSRGTGPGGTTTNNTTQEVTIGGTYLSGNPVNGYNGSMDEIRIYDYVLPPTKIDSLYNYKVNIPPPPPMGLVAYWPLDSNTNDLSGNGYHGTNVGSPVAVSDVNGNPSKAYSFNGTSQYIKCGDILDSLFSRNPATRFSISFWAKTNQLSLAQGDNVLIAKSGASSAGPYQWYMAHENNGSIVALISYSTQAATNFYEVKSQTSIGENQWFHAVLTYDGTLTNNADRLKIYVDKQAGVYSRSTGPGGTTTNNTTQEVTIGGTYLSGNPVNGYSGSMDEIRIYDYVLPPLEIDSLYSYKFNVPPPPPPMGLVAYWPLDSNTNDLSGNGYHGTNVGSPVAVSDVNGNPSKAYSFNGTSQYIKCGDILDSLFSRNPATRFSISFWAKTNQLSLAQGDNVLIAKSGASSAGPYQWYMAHENNGSIVALISYSTQAATNFYEVKSQTSIGENQWFHAVLTYDGTLTNNADRLKIYVDKQAGVYSRSTGPGGTTTNNTTQEVTIGGTYLSGNPVNGYNGSMDEIRIYDYVLSLGEIDTLNLYKQITGLNSKSLVDRIVLYPNPISTGLLHIANIPENLRFNVTIYSVIGQKLVQEFILGSKTKIDLSKMNPGVYLISIESEDENYRIIRKIQID